MVAITPFRADAIAASILRLRDSGRRLVLIGLGKQGPPFIPGVLTYHLPIAGDEPPAPEPDDADPGAAALPEDLTPRQRYLMRRAREEAAHAAKSDDQA